MPTTEVLFYRDDDGSVPAMEWLAEVERRQRKAYEKCRSYLQRLAEFGRELRRPSADLLRDGVYELRMKHLNVNYRILYGFVGGDVVLVSHGFTKERIVPPREIDLAVERLTKFRANPGRHTAQMEADDGPSKSESSD